MTASRPAPVIGVFGGTFDPIHVAHLAVAEAARDALGLERVLFVPNRQPPHKPDQPVTPAADRLAMVRVAIAGNPAFEASTIEIDRDGPSYTADTLERLRADSLAAGESGELALILSVDALAGLASWHEPARVLALATLVVAPRDGYADIGPEAIARFVPEVDARVVVLDGPRMQLSASEVRARAAAGRSVRYLVPDAVAAYIGDHDLYTEPRRMDRS